MVASHHNGGLQLAALYHLIDGQPELGALAISQPADTRRQSLELDSFARQIDPPAQDLVLRKHLQHQVIGDSDVAGVARERNPAKGPASLAEERANIFRHNPRNVISIFHSALIREGPDIVAVVEG